VNLSVNEQYIKSRRRAATRMQAAGLLLTVLRFGLSLFMGVEYWLVFIAYPALIVGFPLWQYGRGQSRRWQAAAKLPPIVLDELRPTPRQQLYAFVPAGGTVIDYLLLSGEGLFVIELRGLTEDEKGRYPVQCRQVNGKDRWTQRLPIIERLARMGEPGLGNPSAALDTKIAALKAWLGTQSFPRPVPVWGLVVFRQPGTILDIEECSYEVLHLNELRSFLNLGQYFDEDMRANQLTSEDRNRLNAGVRGLMGLSATPAPPAPKAPVRKLSPEARAEQERIREIRAARAAAAASKEAPPAGKSAARRAAGPPANAPGKNGTKEIGSRKGS
jgi:hypothetical protein